MCDASILFSITLTGYTPNLFVRKSLEICTLKYDYDVILMHTSHY